MPDPSKLWFVLDMDRGVLGVFRTKREAIESRVDRSTMVVNVHRYGPGAYDVKWHYRGDPYDGDDFFIERGDAAMRGGWDWAIEAWEREGSLIEPFLDPEEVHA